MKPGDKVVCVDDSPCKFCQIKFSLVVNSIYIVKACRLDSFGKLCINVIGSDNIQCCENVLNAYKASRFRLLDELKQETLQRQAIKQTK